MPDQIDDRFYTYERSRNTVKFLEARITQYAYRSIETRLYWNYVKIMRLILVEYETAAWEACDAGEALPVVNDYFRRFVNAATAAGLTRKDLK